jgi:hypothetical protein
VQAIDFPHNHTIAINRNINSIFQTLISDQYVLRAMAVDASKRSAREPVQESRTAGKKAEFVASGKLLQLDCAVAIALPVSMNYALR